LFCDRRPKLRDAGVAHLLHALCDSCA
jgi:hypothetical protein